MGFDHPSPSARSSFDAGDNARKRVCKACDRCRLKKSKCDGSNPCSRCRADNAICQFGERKKSLDKVYPKGYVELLEQHFTQLVSGLREMYRMSQENQSWPGEALPLQRDGHPLTHDILQRLNVLKPSADCSIAFDRFEESPEQVLEALKKQFADSRTNSATPSTDEEPTPPINSKIGFQNPFSMQHTAPQRPEPLQQPRYSPQMFMNSHSVDQNPTMAPTSDPMVVDPPSAPMQLDLSNFAPSHFNPTQLSHLQNMELDVSQLKALASSGLTPYLLDPSSSQYFPWPQSSIKTPGDINWDSWLQPGPN